MSALAYTIGDSATMLRRNLKHQLRYPSMTLMLVGMPIVFLLLFVYVFGGQLGAGLNGHGGRAPTSPTSMDMTQGIIDRFRTMAIARAAVLTGHVIGSLIQTLVGVAIVLGVALAVVFRPTAGPRPPVSWCCSLSRSSGCPQRSAWPPKASRPPATPPCS
jgi:ABC-2 type transport system permease protein